MPLTSAIDGQIIPVPFKDRLTSADTHDGGHGHEYGPCAQKYSFRDDYGHLRMYIAL